MSGKRSVTRGKVYERELCSYLSDAIGLPIFRTVATQQAADRSRGHADLVGLPGLALEAKRVERLDMERCLAQAIVNAQPDEVPLVVTRRSRVSTGASRVILRLDDFLKFYSAWLRQEGVVK